MKIGGFEFTLLPENDSPKAVRNWQMRWSLVACSGWLAQALIVFPLLFTGLPLVGRVAWANEVEAIKQTAQLAANAAAANSTAIDRLTKSQEASSADVDDLLLTVLSQRIRSSISARCRLPASERERINDDIETTQRLYMKRSGGIRAYEPKCSEL